MENTGNSSPDTTELAATETNKLPEILVDKAVLYHGSGISDIKNLLPAEETTIGRGVYLTSDPVSAEGYARRRAKRLQGRSPVVYEVETDNLRLTDLRGDEGIEKFAGLLKEKLIKDVLKPGMPWHVAEAVRRTTDKIDKHSYRGLKDITWNFQDTVTKLIQENGFDGLVTIEGGEGEEIGNHDSYVIFDPAKTKILKEIK